MTSYGAVGAKSRPRGLVVARSSDEPSFSGDRTVAAASSSTGLRGKMPHVRELFAIAMVARAPDPPSLSHR
jgi:hypothetical protein